MRLVDSCEKLLAVREEPLCYLDRHFLMWGDSSGVAGHAVWGCPTRDDALRFVAALQVFLDHPDQHPDALLVDFRQLELVDPDAFEHVRAHIDRNVEVIARIGTREAILRPDGLLGSMVSGFYQITAGKLG